MSLLLGAIADDFTGATDLANTLVKQGMRTVQVIGVPDAQIDIGDAEAVVVALKSRTEPVEHAVEQSLAALKWLRARNAFQFFFKYCSTFDSTSDGNIGPVADALMLALDSPFAFVCPAFPANARTVYQGHLFVGETLLSESSMKDHPLTPMRDANLVRLMDAQSTRRSGLIALTQVRNGPAAVTERAAALQRDGVTYGVVDAIDDADLMTIGVAAADHRLVTGGSGVAVGLPANFRRQGLLSPDRAAELPAATGRQLVLAGSCSATTRAQVAAVGDRWPQRKIDVDALAAGEDVAATLVEWADSSEADTPVLIYASADPVEVADIQRRHGGARAGAMIEAAMGRIAIDLVSRGFDRLVIAGGETSGAVVSALGVTALRIGPEIDPGVPWTETIGAPGCALALKSGNFGDDDFFPRALEMLA